MFKEKGRRIKQESVILTDDTMLLKLGSNKEAIRVKLLLEKIKQHLKEFK